VQLPARTVVVTGAAKGIGLAMVKGFVARGYSVVAADIDAPSLHSLKNDQAEVVIVEADVSRPEGADSVVTAAQGRVDVLCNNAGISDGSLLLEETSEKDWDDCLRINLTSVFLLCRRSIPLMLSNGGGVIINTSSVAGLRGGKGGAAYAPSKFGMVGLTQNIAASYGPQGIRCNAICPGPVETDLKTLAPRSAAGSARLRNSPGRPERARPEDVAAVALWLADDEACLLNGVAIPVESGWLAY
jgi:NAD(P)-dependent dehydrogenase (short-subunit alcohol dehydrogenase family)